MGRMDRRNSAHVTAVVGGVNHGFRGPAVWPRPHTDRTDGAAGQPPAARAAAAHQSRCRQARLRYSLARVTSGGVVPRVPNRLRGCWTSIGGTVFTTGDNVYPTGTAKEFRECYDPSWGRHKSHTRPVPGNHEYEGAGPGPYFDYFGAAAGPPGLGYDSFPLGDWHAIALNSAISVNDGSAQAQWLRSDLAASRGTCTIAYWHHPLFTSGPNGNQGQMRDFWRILYDAGVDVIVNGHDHLYERFAPQNPDGGRDDARGIREFIVGTGGAIPYKFVTTSANSEARIGNTYGVLKFTLQTGHYQWEFIPVSGAERLRNRLVSLRPAQVWYSFALWLKPSNFAATETRRPGIWSSPPAVPARASWSSRNGGASMPESRRWPIASAPPVLWRSRRISITVSSPDTPRWTRPRS